MFWQWKVEVRDLKRFDQIAEALAAFGMDSILHHARIRKAEKGKETSLHSRDAVNAEKMRLLFEHLGGTFLKLGQLLSVRPDLIPPEYCDEFSKLQDSVPPMPFHEVQKVIEEEFKRPVKKVFRSFEAVPIAAASIAQVHKATLRNGKTVAVKVQRPEVPDLISSDLDIMKFFAEKIRKHLHPDVFDPVQIVAEFEQYTKAELDFMQEAHNLEIFSANFKGSKIVKIPGVQKEHSTSRVLTMEFISGMELRHYTKAPLRQRKILVRRIAEAVLKQIFVDGTFHADPHPGNIIVSGNNVVAFVDFGIVGNIDDILKEKLKDLFIGLIHKDLEQISKGLISMNFAPRTVDEPQLREDLRLALGKYYNAEIGKINISQLFNECISVAKRHRIRLPKNFVLLGKSLVTLEGIGKEYDPGFNLVEVAKPFVEGLVKERLKEKLNPVHLLEQAAADSQKLISFARTLPEKTDQFFMEMERKGEKLSVLDKDLHVLSINMSSAVTRLVFGLIVLDLLVSAVVMWKYPPITSAGVSYWALYCLGGALFFLVLFMILSHEEKQRVRGQESQQ